MTTSDMPWHEVQLPDWPGLLLIVITIGLLVCGVFSGRRNSTIEKDNEK